MLAGFTKRELLYISVIYMAAHWFLLVATGWWADDWAWGMISYEATRKMTMELGRPDTIFLYYMVNVFPPYVSHALTLLMMFSNILFLSIILEKWLRLERKDIFWICALYAIIPIYDIRISITIMPYTVGLFFFMAACAHLSVMLFCDKMHPGHRFLNLILFVMSFTTNSNLVFYGVALLMIFSKEKSIAAMKRYMDYMAMPFIFYITTRWFFPTYGMYEDYNKVTIRSLCKAVLLMPAAVLHIVSEIAHKFFYKVVVKYQYLLGIATMLCFILEGLKRHGNWRQARASADQYATNVKLIGWGSIILMFGLFSYVVIRGTSAIAIADFPGRNSVLLGWGSALVIYGFLKCFPYPKICRMMICFLIICGIAYFNGQYFQYQRQAYAATGIEMQLHDNMELGNKRNIVLQELGGSSVSNFYGMNCIAQKVYGREQYMFFVNFNEIKYMYKKSSLKHTTSDFVLYEEYHMRDYDTSYKDIDAIVYYIFNEMESGDVLRTKFYELTDEEKFLSVIYKKSKMIVDYKVNNDIIKEMYAQGNR